jgi:streptogramin lyase
VTRLARYAFLWPVAFSLIVLAACQDRLFDNPFDPQVSEVVFEVANTVFTPALAPRGLTWDGTVLWNIDASAGALIGLSPANGTVVRTLKAPVAAASDAAYDGADLWICGENDVFIFKVNILNGDVQKRLNMQRGSFTACEFALGTLWLADAQSNKILQVDPETAEVRGSFANPGTRAGGLAFDGANFWVSDASTLAIYRLTAAGQLVRKYLSPGPSPQGLAFDGRFLWNADGNQRIYQLRFDP